MKMERVEGWSFVNVSDQNLDQRHDAFAGLGAESVTLKKSNTTV